MTSIFTHQLQPFEENQSPSPVEELANPFDLHYSRSRSPPRAPPSGSPQNTSPPKLSPINTLQRQLSGDPESPPPAWKRRPSFSQTANQIKRSTSQSQPTSPQVSNRPTRSPSDSGYSRTSHLPSRRHPGLMMTTSNPPAGMFLHESPGHSTSSLNDPGAELGLPQPAFRRRPGSVNSSNRSSIHSNLDLQGMTSEDLWNLEMDVTPDMSNPNRKAAERPLDTIRRISRLTEARSNFNAGLPGDVIWPSAPPVTDIVIPPIKSKSFTNVTALNRKSSKLDRKASKRQQSVDGLSASKSVVHIASKTVPNTPMNPKANSIMSSADSSETSLTNAMPKTGLGSRPPSAYYSRDFLSSLAPREGGYAIAAMMGNGLGAVGTMSVEDKRRSGDFEVHRSRAASRAPLAKSAGMGRWSLDGGEHYNSRPYMTGSAATTSSNLTGGKINSPEPSPPTEDSRSPSASYLPEGASPPASLSPTTSIATAPSVLQRLDIPPPLQASSSSPINPSPLSQSLSQTLTKSPPTASHAAIPAAPPIPVSPPRTISPQKSKKDLAKEAKAAEKAEAARLAKEKADKAKADAMRTMKERQEAERATAEKKAQEKAAAVKAEADRKAKYAQMKEDAKRKEKEAKEKKKAEKEAARKQTRVFPLPPPTTTAKKPGPFGLKAPSLVSLPSAISFSRRASSSNVSGPSEQAPPVPAIPADFGGPAKAFPKSSLPSGAQAPYTDAPRKTTVSAPLPKPIPVPPVATESKAGKKKLGFLGTLKKRLSVMDSPASPARVDSPAGPTPPPKSPVTPKAGNSGSSADTAIPPPSRPPPGPLAEMEAPKEESVVIINAPTASPAPEVYSTPSRSPAISQSAGLSPPAAHTSAMETAARPPRSSSYQVSPQSVRSAVVPNPDAIPGQSTVSPSSSVRRSNRGSVHGPRPMPVRARSHSATSRSSQVPSSAAAPSPSLAASASPGQSFPFHVAAPLHPATPAGDSILSHNAPSQSSSYTTGQSQTASDLASPFSEGSRKSSMTSADADMASVAAYLNSGDLDHKPIREGSDDTIHPDPLSGGPIIAAH